MTLFSTTQVVAAEGTPYAFGFKELLLWSSGSTSVLWAATGSGGGLASFDILTDGTLILVESIDYPSFIRAGVDPDLSGAMGDGALLVGGLMGFGFEMAATGTSGSYVDFGDASLSYISPIWIAIGGAHFVLAGDPDGGTFLYDWSSAAPEPVAMWSTDTLGDAAALPGGYVAMAFPSADRLDIWLPGADGSADVVATVGATDGLGWSVPGLLDQVSLGGYSYLIVGGQGSSSLTVLNFGPDGALTVADHVIDSPDTRFATVQAIDAISLGGEAYVAAGGADDGITILHLLDNGRLVPLQTIVDDNVTGLTNVTGLAFFAAGGVLSLAASSEGDAGLTVFSAEVSQMPRAVIGTDAGETLLGSSGPDTIFDGGGSDVMTGRGGADVFLIDTDGRLDRITDFQPGLDRIDLSLIEGVYDPADLTMTMTATGLRIEYGSETLIVENAAGGPIDPATLDRADLFGLDRPPLALSGDSITGGSGNDILEGGLGGDVIDGGGGDDTVDGGFGNDWIEGADGQDSLSGGDGRDIISGGSGADLVDGGNGADLLFGGAEEDTLAGGAGDDLLLGGAGDDVLSGGSGQDTLRGGDGADLLDGGDGSDRLDGGPGDDSLTGGADADIFVMRPGGGSDTITDLEEGDLIDLLLMRLEMNADEMLDAHAHQVEADVVIDFGEESLTLTGVDLADLGADDFLL